MISQCSKTHGVLLPILLVISLLMGCEDDLGSDSVPEHRPVIALANGPSLISGPAIILAGDTVRISYTISVESSSLHSFEVMVNNERITPDTAIGLTAHPLVFEAGTRSYSGLIMYEAGKFGQVSDHITLKATANRPGSLTGLSTEKSFSIHIGRSLSKYTGQVLNERSSTANKGFDVHGRSPSTANSPNTDIINVALGSSSFNPSIRGVNGTTLALTPNLDVQSANSAEVKFAYLRSTPRPQLNGLIEGDVFVAKIGDETYAAIKVTGIANTINDDNDAINFELYVE